MTLLKAIATQEGFYVPGSRAARSNNPGNIVWGVWAQQHGATNIEHIPAAFNEQPRFAYFPTPEMGFAALLALLESPAYAGLTIEEMVAKYAPSVENDVNSYVRNLCKLVPCQPTDLISKFLGAE